MKRIYFNLFACFFILGFFTYQPLYAQTLDQSFGQGGQFLDTYSIYPGGISRIAPDGKIVHLNNKNDFSFDTGILIRYTQDGQMDPSFGTDGYVEFSLGGGFSGAGGMVVAPDNSIYVTGTLFQQPWIKKFSPDGSLDLSFGTDGTRNLGDSSDLQATSIAHSNEGNLIVSHGYSSGGVARAAISKFDLDGNLDLTFGNGGILYFPDLGIFLRHLYIADNGDIFAGYFDFSEDLDRIMKYNKNGSAISDFGNAGAITFGGGQDVAGRFNRMTEDKDGNLYWMGSDAQGYFVLKTDPLGNAIMDFGIDGRLSDTWGTEISVLSDFLLLDDGGFILNGAGGSQDTSNVFMRAYASNGTINTQFGDNGTIDTDHGEQETTHLLTSNKNGTLLQLGIAGRSQEFEGDYFATRYIFDQTLYTSTAAIVPFSIYPNPADQSITIRFDEIIDGISIGLYDPLGQLLAERSLEPNQSFISVPVADFVSGVYYAQIKRKNGQFSTHKWVKK